MLDEAIMSYQKYLEIYLQDDKCYYNIVNAYKKKGMFNEADYVI